MTISLEALKSERERCRAQIEYLNGRISLLDEQIQSMELSGGNHYLQVGPGAPMRSMPEAYPMEPHYPAPMISAQERDLLMQPRRAQKPRRLKYRKGLIQDEVLKCFESVPGRWMKTREVTDRVKLEPAKVIGCLTKLVDKGVLVRRGTRGSYEYTLAPKRQ